MRGGERGDRRPAPDRRLTCRSASAERRGSLRACAQCARAHPTAGVRRVSTAPRKRLRTAGSGRPGGTRSGRLTVSASVAASGGCRRAASPVRHACNSSESETWRGVVLHAAAPLSADRAVILPPAPAEHTSAPSAERAGPSSRSRMKSACPARRCIRRSGGISARKSDPMPRRPRGRGASEFATREGRGRPNGAPHRPGPGTKGRKKRREETMRVWTPHRRVVPLGRYRRAPCDPPIRPPVPAGDGSIGRQLPRSVDGCPCERNMRSLPAGGGGGRPLHPPQAQAGGSAPAGSRGGPRGCAPLHHQRAGASVMTRQQKQAVDLYRLLGNLRLVAAQLGISHEAVRLRIRAAGVGDLAEIRPATSAPPKPRPCPRCGRDKGAEIKHCAACREDLAAQARRARYAAMEARRARLIAAGLCVGCGARPAIDGRRCCEACARKNRLASSACNAVRYERRKRAGICVRCGRRPRAEGGRRRYVLCAACIRAQAGD